MWLQVPASWFVEDGEPPLAPKNAIPAGKSTHLDILAGRKTVGEIKGTVNFAGQRPTTAFLKRFTGAGFPSLASPMGAHEQCCFGRICNREIAKRPVGYVEQFDTLLPELTVAEMLLYTAELKCAVSVSISPPHHVTQQ